MHGMIFAELRKFVDAKLGGGAWGEMLEGAGMKGKIFLTSQEYPDADLVTLVGAASVRAGLPVPAVLEAFGEFVAPSLLGMYPMLVKPEWKTLELLEFTEDTIHKVVRMRNPGAKPAELKGVRVGPKELHLTYTSRRKLCPVARGIIKGVGAHFRERVTVRETECMHRGAAACQMVVQVA